jgi:hypothetical protein
MVSMAIPIHDGPANLLDREHKVRKALFDNRPGHAENKGSLLVLGNHRSSPGFEFPAALKAIFPHASENHGQHPVTEDLNERREGNICTGFQALKRGTVVKHQAPVAIDDEVLPSWGQKGVVDKNRLSSLGFPYRKRRKVTQAIGQAFRETRGHVLDKDHTTSS